MFIFLSYPKSFAQADLLGHWEGNCIIEKMNKTGISFCDFCPFSITENQRTIEFKEFEMVFKNNHFDLLIDSVSTKVDYKFDDELKILEFIYKEKTHKFKALRVAHKTTNIYKLKDLDGGYLLLNKKE